MPMGTNLPRRHRHDHRIGDMTLTSERPRNPWVLWVAHNGLSLVWQELSEIGLLYYSLDAERPPMVAGGT
jgi:hypothetical protein